MDDRLAPAAAAGTLALVTLGLSLLTDEGHLQSCCWRDPS